MHTSSMNRYFVSVISVLFIAVGVTVAAAWTGPTQAAPDNGTVTAPLNVSGTAQSKVGGLLLNSGGATNGLIVQSGNVGISTTTPSKKFSVEGDALINGNVYAVGYFHTSDARMKTDITTAAGLAIVERLRGVTFNWKKDGTPSAGVIAQEVEQVMPSAVHTDAVGMKSVEYDQLVGQLIEAIKQQQTQIDSLSHEIETLKVAR